MTARLLDGKSLAAQLQAELAEEVGRFRAACGVVPCLAAVLVGEDPASEVYVRNKRAACERVGIDSRLERLPAATDDATLLALVERLNADPAVHGVLVQLPLPRGLATTQILDAIDPRKDVDAFHPLHVGRLSQGRPWFLPCTPHGVMQILARNELRIAGRHVVIVGRSDIVGRPLSLMLSQRDCGLGPDFANATVTLCHSRTENLAEHTRRADVVIAAAGQPRLITGDHVRPGAIVIDVGINRVDGKLVGDVDFDSVLPVAGHLTPVPGGVGPLTVTMLLHNTLAAARGSGE